LRACTAFTASENATSLEWLRTCSMSGRLAQWIAEVLPLTHFLRLIRGIMPRGASVMDLWAEALALVAFIAVMMTTAILRFHKRLD
jgi:ABC-type multidrug transport system permease subunit